jgi:DNA-binding LacI/PurR family transcriptional regulator
MSDLPKHREISRELLAEIAMAKYGPAGRLPSEQQLVKRFGVSRPTVARALRDLQAEGLIERRTGSGTYVRANAPKPSGTRQVGLLIPNLGTAELFGQICGELASVARAADYTLLWGDSAHPGDDQKLNEKRAVELCEQFIEHRVAGVFFAPFEFLSSMEEINRRIVERFSKAGVPLLFLDRDMVPFPHRSNIDLVSIDNFAAGSILAEHLIKLGSQRVAFVTRPDSAPSVSARIAGVRDALARHQLEPPRDWVHIGDPEDQKFVRLLIGARRWDAVVCASDLTAAHLLRSMERNKIRVPDDLRVVSFDDDKYATLVGVSLTTIRQPARDIAITAFRAMFDRMAEPTLPARTIFVTPQLVVRESCGAYLPRTKK